MWDPHGVFFLSLGNQFVFVSQQVQINIKMIGEMNRNSFKKRYKVDEYIVIYPSILTVCCGCGCRVGYCNK